MEHTPKLNTSEPPRQLAEAVRMAHENMVVTKQLSNPTVAKLKKEPRVSFHKGTEAMKSAEVKKSMESKKSMEPRTSASSSQYAKLVKFKRSRPPLRRSGHKVTMQENAMSHDIDCFFRYNGDRLVRKDITVDENEQKKARAWVFFLIFMQIILCIAYALIIYLVISRDLIYLIFAWIFGTYFVLKLLSVLIFVIKSKQFCNPCLKPEFDVENPEQYEKILICIPAYNEDQDAFLRTINSVVKSNYPKDKLYMFFIVDGNKANSFQKLMSVLFKKDFTEKIPANERQIRHGTYEGVAYTVFLKEQNRGKRDSQWLFVEILRTMVHKPTYIMFVDSDTAFSKDSILLLSNVLNKDKENKVAGVCGKLEISNFGNLNGTLSDNVFKFTTLFIVGFQVYEYHFNQILSKQAEAAYGSVTCLPGAFSLFRREHLINIEYEMVEESALPGIAPDNSPTYTNRHPDSPRTPGPGHSFEKFSPRTWIYRRATEALPLTLTDFFSKPAKGIVDRNLYELGEDRTLTIRFLEQGLTTIYEPRAVAYTECPDTLRVLMLQRRRWINSTFVNVLMMLLSKKLYTQLKTIPIIIFAAFDFFSSYLLPANAIILMYCIWGPVVGALSEAFSIGISIEQVLMWWILIQIIIITTTSMATSDMFYVINAFFGGCMMGLSLYYFINSVVLSSIYDFMEDPMNNWALLVMIAVFPLLHLLVSMTKPQMFFTAAFYYFMIPTIAVTIPFYSFFHMDDFTWGNR